MLVSQTRFFCGKWQSLDPNGDRLIPAFVVACNARDQDSFVDDRGEAVIRHPWLVIEVLSAATAADDVTDKLDAYQTIDELTHYVVIDSRRRAMRLYQRPTDGSFATPVPLQRLLLPTLAEHGISMDEIYRDTTVPLPKDMTSSPRF